MINGLFETHINVLSLKRAMDFYENVLGLELGIYEEGRRVAFYWIGKRGEAMIGLWEKPKEEIQIQHYAFRSTLDDILNHSEKYLQKRNLDYYNFLRDNTKRPMVFAWMPAIAIYFNDPDGHILEFIAMIDGKPQPELGIVSYEDWLKRNELL